MSKHELDVQMCKDRLDILDLFARYCRYTDTCEWQKMRTVFTEDAQADYSSVAEYVPNHATVLNGLEEMISFWTTAMANMGPGLTHFMTNHLIELDGDTATATVYNHVLNLGQGGVYHTHARRTPQGWRLDKLLFEVRYFAEMSQRMNGQMIRIDGRSV